MDLLDEDQARVQVREYIDSREWWMFPAPSSAILRVTGAAEKRYYSGKANEDFQILLGPVTLIAAHKRRMTGSQLQKLITKHGCSKLKGLVDSDRDILIDPENLGEALVWGKWLGFTTPSPTELSALLEKA